MKAIYILSNKCFSDINPVVFGHEQCIPGKTVGPHIRDYYLIHYVLSGKGTFFCDDEVYTITPGQFFVVRPHEVITYVADDKQPWKYIWIGFEGKLTEQCSFLKKRVVNFNGNAFNDMLKIDDLKSMREEFLVSKIFQLIVEMSANKTQNQNANDYVENVKEYVLLNYMNDINLNDIAHKIGIDRSYLSRMFKSQMNMTFQEYIISTRLKKGMQFLKDGYNVSEAAIMCGYKEPCTFSRAYKKYFKVSPKEAKSVL